ncbi:MAG TPA: AsmA-like C-terminal region-containing protein [Cytophagaceae bacterium]|nr:AsmA-like C-terminal region-containing protein [Cytophagaceae bacterium]
MIKTRTIYKILIWSISSIAGLFLLTGGFVYVFKDKIIQASIQEINKYLNTKVDVDPSIELSLFEKFPQVAVAFKNVKIYESIPGSTNQLGKTDRLFFTFNLWNILDGKYIIQKLYLENGEFYLRVNKHGENNYTILKKDTSNTSQENIGGFDLTDISIKNVLVKYLNESNEQYYEVLSHELKASFTFHQDQYLITLSGPQLVNKIRLHHEEYFRGKEIFISSNLAYNDLEKKLTILPTSVKLKQSEFKVEGSYVYKGKNFVDIKIDNEQGDIFTLLSLVPPKYYKAFSSYQSDGEVYFHATVKGVISNQENAAINVNFGCKQASFFHPNFKKKISDASFYGTFSNGQQKNTQTSSLKIENIHFLFDDKMIQGNFLYENFKKPFIAFDATGTIDAGSIMNFYKINGVESASGTIDFNIEFKGFLDDLKTREGHQRIETNGEISLKELTCVPSNVTYKWENLNGTFLFNKNDIAITDLTAKVGESDFKVNGLLKNFFGALLLENGRMLTDVRLRSNRLNIEELLAFQNTRPEEKKDSGIVTQNGVFPFLEKYVINMELDVKEILYKKIILHKFSGSINFNQPQLKADNIRFYTSGGEIALSSQLNFESDQKIETTIRTTLTTIHIDSLFYLFDNFGQNFITSKNLRGEFSGTAEIAFSWNNKGEIDTKNLVANIDGSILKGELIQFEPMQKLARFIDAQELAHIQFSEIKNKVFIENRKLSFPEMQILSNVSDISISGTHTFDNEMDYKLTVPLKNIRKPKIDKDASFGAIEEDSKKGSTLFLTLKGTADNYKIGYDTKRTKHKISEDLKKEKQEFKNLFKKKEEEIQHVKPNKEEFFEFE